MKFLIAILFCSFLSFSQIDSAGIFAPLVSIHLGGQLPGGDLSQRFGADLNMGGSFMIKTKKNWLLGVESNYFFGRNVKEDVLTQLRNENGEVTDNRGYPADIRITERGFGLHITGGKVFKLLAANPNSGLMITGGVGYLQHKIKLYDGQQEVASIRAPLSYGLDRLSRGVSFTQFIGYMYLSNNRFFNIYFGAEFYEAFTQSVRKLNYDTGLPDTQKRFDMLYGLRIGWILPLYKKTPNEYYYD